MPLSRALGRRLYGRPFRGYLDGARHRPTRMQPSNDLASLRAEIDRIDDRLVDLLVERVAVVGRIAAAKDDRTKGGLALRPAREAAILRRLVARARGRLPAATLVRMWRELLAATTRLQTPLSVVVWAPPEANGVWDLARDQFGSATPFERASSAAGALRRAAEDPARIAVLPMPEDGQDWWPVLLEPAHRRLAAIARLPFVDGPGPPALALAALEPEPSEDDLSLVVLETPAPTSRARLADALDRGRLEPRWRAVVHGEDTTLHLVEVKGFHARSAPFASSLLGSMGDRLRSATVLGAYPRPIAVEPVALGPAAATDSGIPSQKV